jgi:hypothetical protein
MQITPFVGETIVSSDTVSIRVNPKDRERADDLVLRTSTITMVKDEHTYAAAREAAGQLKSMLTEIADSQKAAKGPFTSIVNTISALAKDVAEAVKTEHERILRICSAYVAKIEAEEEAKRVQLRKAQAEAEARIEEARRAALAAKTKAEIAQAHLNLASASVHRDGITYAIAQEKPALVPGGRLTHPWRFELVDPLATLKAGAGAKRLLRIEVDFLACQDSVRAQLEKNPDQVPSLPGIRVIRETKVTIKATAQTS